jgi:hypothetical protein
MSKGITSKTRLLLGASTLFVIVGTAGMAHAAEVQVAGAVTVAGDTVGSANQNNTTAATAASTDANTTLTATTTAAGTATIDSAVSGATTIVNTSTQAIADRDDATATDKVALGTLQKSTGATAIINGATTSDTDVVLTTGATSGSKVTLSNSRDAASATTNTATQRVTLDSTTLLSTGTTSAAADTVNAADVDATGAVVIGSLQSTTLTSTIANVKGSTTEGSTFTLAAGDVTSSELDLVANSQNANATGSTATNAIGLSGTTVGVGIAIASQQDSDAGSAVTAGTIASAFLTATSMDTGSTATVSGNQIQAKALSANTSNTISVNATSVALPPADSNPGAVINLSGDATVSGAFATVNDQSVLNVTTATVDAEARGLVKLEVAGDVKGGSALANDANTISARAQGAVTTNTTNLNIGGTLSSGTPATNSIANGAVVANVQSIATGANVLADVDGAAIDMVKTTVGGALADSSISSSANRIQAFADGANATNNLAVSATTISAAAAVGGAPNVGTTAAGAVSTADTAFAVVNAQISGTGTVIANVDEPATISSLVTGATSNSDVTLNGNVIDAFGVSNKATNGLSLTGTTIATDAGVLNVQSSNAPVTSTIGLGTDTTAATAANRTDGGVIAEFDANVSGSAVEVNSNVTRGSAIGNVGNNTLAVSATTLSGGGTPAKAIAVGSVDGITTATGDYSLANSQSLDVTSASKTNVAAAYGIDVNLITGAATTNSSLSVSSNNQIAEALGNSGTNRIALSATGAGADTLVDPTAALSNVQDGNAAEIVSVSKMTVFANAESSASSVALNGNSNTALGVINNASNSIGVSAVTLDGLDATVGSITASSNTTTADYALNSVQGASGTLASTARSDIYNLDQAVTTPANAGAVGSVITLTGNATTAEGTANRISNQLSASATDNGATAGLNNSQTSAATVDVNAVSIVNATLATTSTTVSTGTAQNSSISVEDNSTTALARGNSASNALNYDATSYTGPTTLAAIGTTATVGAAVAMRNGQTNSGALNATSTSATYTLSLDAGATGAAGALNSSAMLANNSVAANGFGNVASNTLNATTSGATAPSVGLLNDQSNSGGVTTLATGTTFTLALNADGIGATNSNATMANNTVSSNAYGNMAMNSVTMAAFGAGVPSSAVSSVQSNTAAISATATNVTFGMTVGSNSGSALRVSGNNTTAQAVGNSSVNSINGGN